MLQTFWSWRRQVAVFLVSQILACLVVVGFGPVKAQGGGVVIAGLQVSGGSGRTSEEYVEIYNTSAEPIDISGWRLGKLTKSGALGSWTYLASAFASSTFLPGHTFALLVHVDAQGVFVGDWLYASSTLAEDNSLALLNSAKEVIDLVGWGQAAHFSGQPLPTAGTGRLARRLEADKSLGDFGRSVDAPRRGLADLFLATTTEITTTTEEIVISTTAPELTETEVTSTQTENAPVQNLVLSEIYPEPNTGETEFVELYNPNLSAVDMTDWYLVDGSGARTTVSGTIAAQSFVAVTPIKGNLNNVGDQVQLWFGDSLVETVSYGEWIDTAGGPHKGQSLVRELPTVQAEWKIGQPTPALANQVLHEVEADTTEANETEDITKSSLGKLKINEIFPDPAGADFAEFIELINPTNADIILTQWRLEVGEQEYLIPEQTVRPGGLVVLWREQNKLVLPNQTKEKVRLIRDDGSVADTISYQTPTIAGAAWVMVPGRGWGWSQSSTPGLTNVWKELNRAPYAEITAPAKALPGEIVDFTSDNVYDPDHDELAYHWDLGDGQQSSSTAISTVYDKPGKYNVVLRVADPFGLNDEAKWILQIAEPLRLSTSTAAIENKKITTTVKNTTVTSTKKTSSSAKTKKTGTTKSTALASGPAILVAARLLDQNDGARVSIKGEVTSGNGKYWRLDDGTAEVVVILPAAKLPAGLGWKKKTEWQVTGVVKKYKEDWAVAVNSWADLKKIGQADNQTNTKTNLAMPFDKNKVAQLWWLAPFVLIGGLLWLRGRKKSNTIPLAVV